MSCDPVGVVTEKDMLRVLKSKKNLELIPAKDIMAKHPVTIKAEQTVADALELLHRHNIRRLIITTRCRGWRHHSKNTVGDRSESI